MVNIKDVHFAMHVEENVIALIDIGTGVSITNAAEEVVAELEVLFGDDLAHYRIIYRDTMGFWDGLAHLGDRFLGFVPLRCTANERGKAIDLARQGKDRNGQDWPSLTA
jgi:hypothetical protein